MKKDLKMNERGLRIMIIVFLVLIVNPVFLCQMQNTVQSKPKPTIKDLEEAKILIAKSDRYLIDIQYMFQEPVKSYYSGRIEEINKRSIELSALLTDFIAELCNEIQYRERLLDAIPEADIEHVVKKRKRKNKCEE